jgi:zinc and cadmium transporter
MTSAMLFPLLAALAVMAVSFSGKIFTYRFLGDFLLHKLPYLATFAGGVFLVIIWHLSEEALHEGTPLVFVFGALGGAAALWFATRIIAPEHHHHEIDTGHTHARIDGRRVLLSDAVHNVGDGIILVLAFAADTNLGIAAALGIVLHEMVQEISEFFVLKEAGYSDTQALLRNFAASSSIFLGVAVAFLLSNAETLTGILSAVATGALLFVVLFDLLPNARACIRAHGKALTHAGALILGAALMFGVQSLTPHEEDHAEEESGATVQLEQ